MKTRKHFNPTRRHLWRVLMCVLVVAVLAWYSRQSFLVKAATLLVSEDPLAPVDMMVVSNSNPRASAFEVALLYDSRTRPHVLMAEWHHDPLVQSVREMSIPYLDSTAISRLILERRGVPSSAITILPDPVDGTNSEVAAIAEFVARHHVRSLLVITARSHTVRTKWLLQHTLPRTRVLVRSSRFDGFKVESWWRDRDQTLEVFTEYLRLCNTVLFRDLWARPVSASPGGHIARQ